MNRQAFLKQSCKACLLGIATLYGAEALAMPYRIKPYKTTLRDDGTVWVPCSLFEKDNSLPVQVKGWMYEIAVTKNKEAGYTALLLKCTHMDNQLGFSKNGYECSMHGSRFTSAGEVEKGPAELPLKKYSCTSDTEKIIIQIIDQTNKTPENEKENT